MLNERKISSELFEKLFLLGAQNLRQNLQVVNDLNVFPIPDGDTGENMYLTMQGGVDRLTAAAGGTLSEKAAATAQGMLLGARGNSGVILSQLFYGLSVGLEGLEEADIRQFGAALKEGVKHAYGAVAKPVEGTILTVAREAVDNACNALGEGTTAADFFAKYLSEMKKSLEKTPELLEVLKEAGVVDSGGAGLVYIAEGFCKALGGEEIVQETGGTSNPQKQLDFSLFTADSVMEFGYCTELLLQLQHAKTDVDAFSVDQLISYLETIGDSIVAFKTGSVIKVHVHTMTPYMVLQYCQKYGEFLTVKIENMTLQHNETQEKGEEAKPAEASSASLGVKMPKRARRQFATVTVAAGEGLQAVFKEMGADFVVSGGQTNNPSSEDFLAAFDAVNADHVFVLPNNGNIVMAAKQAAAIYQDSTVHVIESKSIGQGYSALSMLDYDSEDAESIAAAMYESMENTVTGMVCRAVRDAQVNGVAVTKDAYMGFADHTMHVCRPTKTEAVCALAEALGVGEKDYVIVVYGKDAAEEERGAFRLFAAERYPNVELYEIEGEQEVYDFLLIVE